jgi:S1-C subfamily serine protease
VDGATSVTVQINGSGPTYTAKVLGTDATDDVALLQIQGVSNLPTVKIGDPSELQVGDAVLGLGNALGRGGTPAPALGSVTALGQTITATDEGGTNPETLKNLIEVDAPIQPGDSGGPLVDANGNVVGMDSAGSASSGAGRFSLGGSSTGDGFAIPIDHALAIAHQIESGQSSSTVHIGARAILGVVIDNSSASSGGSGRFGGFNPFDPSGGAGNSGTSSSSNGAAVADVQAGGPADDAGIAAGDTITSIGTKTVGSADDLSAALGSSKPGDKMQVGWTDANGQSHTATVTLVAGPPA